MIRTCHITTRDTSLALLYEGRHRLMVELGFEVCGICAPGPLIERVQAEGMCVYPIPLSPHPGLLGDLAYLWRLTRLLRRERFDLIEIGTTKAVLLASIAAWLARQPLRIVIIHGTHYSILRGLRRLFFMWTDRIGCKLAQRVVAVCGELRDELIRDRLCPAKKVIVYHHGSCAGLDLERFTRTPELAEQGRALRRSRGIADDVAVIGTIGRIKREKGTVELLEAFQALQARGRNVCLLIVGNFEAHDPVPEAVRRRIEEDASIWCVGHRPDVERFYAAMDIFAFPTYREGFGNVAIEASAMELPIVASDVVGCRESAPAGVASILVPPQDADALAEALDRLILDPALRRGLGQGGRERVRREFDRRDVWRAAIADYGELLARQGKSLPCAAAEFAAHGARIR